MFSNIVKQIEIDSILIDREARQRSIVTPDSVLSLAVSIGRSQWISPILVDQDTHYLIAGERRLMSVKVLRAAMAGDYSSFSDPTAAREALFPVCTCQKESWNQWNKIPAQLGKDLTSTDLVMFEFIENAHRKDLPWQDKAKAIYGLHIQGMADEESWTATQTASILGVARNTVQENLRVWRVYCDEGIDNAVKSLVEESPTLRSAAQSLERYMSRRETGLGVNLSSAGAASPKSKPKIDTPLQTKPGPAKGTDVYLSQSRETTLPVIYEEEDYSLTDSKPSDRLLINADFTKWAASYEGEPFNFLHCDFPYGIDFNSGEYTSRVESKVLGNYDDSADVYWSLLETLQSHKSKLLAPQAHVMFWFSQNLRRETEDFFKQMGGFVQPFLMIWHCDDGIVPDPQRYGRRTYETAMLVTFGDRKIIAPRALSVVGSRNAKTRIHRSQKPVGILEHFFGMFVDDSSTVLDPTAGSGTSLIAATHQEARRVVGLEQDESFYTSSCSYIDSILGDIAL